MRWTKRMTTALLCVAVMSPLGAASLDEVIAKHIDARGGRANWEKIVTLRFSGDYTAFSRVEPDLMLDRTITIDFFGISA